MAHEPHASSRDASRRLPSLDTFTRLSAFAATPRSLLLRVARRVLEGVRARTLRGEVDADAVERLLTEGSLVGAVLEQCEAEQACQHTRVLNATGVVLHTGLGRAPLAAAAVAALSQAARYAVVEVDRRTGERNQREAAVAALLGELTGARAALVVNNNAAAVNLVLRALAEGRDAVVSRGELVEIGGGFRMPDVMRQAGCRMVEVGATNRTHVRDYADAIGEHTAVLLKVHPSNFRMLGFTAAPTLCDLVELARRHPGVLVVEDVGSGLLWPEPIAGLEGEPLVAASVRAGAHLVTFSGDKLLGGPQCGILLGDEGVIARCRAHPLYRALRCDKLVLAALEATLRIYRDGDPLLQIPTLAALAAPAEAVHAHAVDLCERLADLHGEVVATEAFAGSGANPARPLPSYAVALPGGDATCAQLRCGLGVPVFARLDGRRTLLDLRSLSGEDVGEVEREVRRKLAAPRPGAPS